MCVRYVERCLAIFLLDEVSHMHYLIARLTASVSPELCFLRQQGPCWLQAVGRAGPADAEGHGRGASHEAGLQKGIGNQFIIQHWESTLQLCACAGGGGCGLQPGAHACKDEGRSHHRVMMILI